MVLVSILEIYPNMLGLSIGKCELFLSVDCESLFAVGGRDIQPPSPLSSTPNLIVD